MSKRKDRDEAPDSEAPESERPADDPEGAPTEFDEPSDEEKHDESPRVTRAELRAFIGRPATYARARGIIGDKVKGQEVDDLVGEAIAEALETRDENLPRAGSIQAWFDRICRRRVAKRYAKVERRKKHEGPMPEAPAVVDEAGEPVEDPGDAVKDVDPRVEPHPVATDWRAEGWLLRRWMRQEVASDPRDRETWAIMEELAAADEDEKLSYKKLAERHGMTEAQLYKRMERLREKYKRRYEKWRNGMFVALLKWGAVAVVAGVAIAWVVWKLLHPAPPPEIGPDPDLQRPVPSASPSAAPPFEPALPTQEEPQTPKPQTPPKPPQ
jgi:DNA-directed RNA polymerase specialized sigma24 family protein